MITLYAAMLVMLGFLMAALIAVVVLPAYRRRVERFAAEAVKRTLPLNEHEIRADKDRLKAAYAMDVHKLETKLEEAAISAARQSVEINRRDARVHEVEEALAAQKLRVEEHENARRVLEQAILDRLPKVEQRLVDARKLLAERDADIALLAETSAKQTAALEEATQINIQQSEDLLRQRTTLETRAARRGETIGDPRFDGEVALRTEIEMLRAKTRDQSALIKRLQTAASDADQGATDDKEIKRLRSELARVEAQVLHLKAGDTNVDTQRAGLENRIREMENLDRDRLIEIAKLEAALKSYESANSDEVGVTGLSAKAEISALQAEVDQQRLTIQSLRADVTGGAERLARQAQHFRDELRRLGSGATTEHESGRNADSGSPQASLAERLSKQRSPRHASTAVNGAEKVTGEGGRGGGFLKAVNGGASEAPDEAAAEESPASKDKAASDGPPRRPRLLERLGGGDKS
ncbi:MAG: hypothetical protein ACKVP4_03710 [Hyphomicrobium sp.]